MKVAGIFRNSGCFC